MWRWAAWHVSGRDSGSFAILLLHWRQGTGSSVKFTILSTSWRGYFHTSGYENKECICLCQTKYCFWCCSSDSLSLGFCKTLNKTCVYTTHWWFNNHFQITSNKVLLANEPKEWLSSDDKLEIRKTKEASSFQVLVRTNTSAWSFDAVYMHHRLFTWGKEYLTSARNLTMNVCLCGRRFKLAKPSRDVTWAEPSGRIVTKSLAEWWGQQQSVIPW